MTSLKQVEQIQALSGDIGWQKKHIEYGLSFNAYLNVFNRTYSTQGKVKQSAFSYFTSLYAISWIRNDKQIYPILFGEVGYLIHNPYKADIIKIKYQSKVLVNIGLGGAINISKSWRATLIYSTGKSRYNVGLTHVFS